MKIILEYLPMWLVIALGLTIGTIGFSQNYNNNKSYESAVTLSSNDHYNVYLDGEKQDKNSFKISSLDKDKYSFKVDYENENININTKENKNNKDNDFIPLPIFFN